MPKQTLPLTSEREQIYLSPEQLVQSEANEKARPTETPEQRKKRVQDMVESITANGQEYPVLVKKIAGEDGDQAVYEYADGGSRVDALTQMGSMSIWCSVLPDDTDMFRVAVTGNLHRAQATPLDMAYIVQETFDRQGFKGTGAGKRVAEYLGIPQSRVSEYQKLLKDVTPAIKEMLLEGKITTLDAALELLNTPVEHQEEVAQIAEAVAQEEGEKKAKKEREHNPRPDVPVFDPSKARVTKKNVVTAKKKLGVQASGKQSGKTKEQILDFFEGYTEQGYWHKTITEFALYFRKWVEGKGDDQFAYKMFERIATKEAVPEGVKEREKAEQTAKAEPKKAEPKAPAKKDSKSEKGKPALSGKKGKK